MEGNEDKQIKEEKIFSKSYKKKTVFNQRFVPSSGETAEPLDGVNKRSKVKLQAVMSSMCRPGSKGHNRKVINPTGRQ